MNIIDTNCSNLIVSYLFTGKAGSWRFKLENQNTSSARVAVSVLSKSAHPNQPPITAQAFWGHRQIKEVKPGLDPEKQTLHSMRF